MQRIKGFLKRHKYRKELTPLIDRYLFFLEHPGESTWGSITDEEEKGIARAVDKARAYAGPIIEIGALFGYTTQLLAMLKEAKKRLIAVENFSWSPFGVPREVHRIMTRRTLRYCLNNCNTELFEGSNTDFYKTYRGATPSMIFIDAGHSYEEVATDIRAALDLDIPVICGHDYSAVHPGVRAAVDEFFGGDIDVVGSVWCVRPVPARRIQK